MDYSLPYGIKFIFFDGQQSIYSYKKNDGLHGSKYAAKLYAKNCIAMILLDMIGSKDLKIQFPPNSDNELIQITNSIINKLNYQQHFIPGVRDTNIIDDTTPFEKYNIPTINFIQMDYPYWHTNEDTFDKLDMNSFRIVGNVVLQLLTQLENK